MTTQKSNEALSRVKELPSEKEWLTRSEVAIILNRSRSWVWNKVNAGIIESKVDITKGVNKEYRIVHRNWLLEFLEQIVAVKPDPVE